MPIFQGFWKDKEKEEDGFFVSGSSSFKVVFMGKKTLEEKRKIPLFLQGLILFYSFFYVRAAKTNF